MKYKHEKTGNIYIVLNDNAKMKVGEHWIKCIIYQGENDEIFVREAEDFYTKFNEV